MDEIMKVIRETANIKQEDLLHDFRPLFVVYKDGSVERFVGTQFVPPSVEGVTGVESKDVVISTDTGVFVRLFKPLTVTSDEKLPLLVCFHGGDFVVETVASPLYHNYLNVLSSKANVIAVSVEYRKAPENPLPAAYDDSWAAVEWIRSSLAGSGAGAEPWLSTHVDPARIFLAGDSAGANIAHHMAKRIAKCNNVDGKMTKIALKGLVLVHPYFWGKERIGSELQKLNLSTAESRYDRLWKLAYPGTSGSDDPLFNPEMDPELSALAGEKVLVFVAENDLLRDRGVHYKELLIKSGWKGEVEVIETEGENHEFHLYNPVSPKAAELMDQYVAFINSS